MGERDEDSASTAESGKATLQAPSSFEVACPCLNIRILVSKQEQQDDGGDGVVQVELDEEAQRSGGAVRVVSAMWAHSYQYSISVYTSYSPYLAVTTASSSGRHLEQDIQEQG